MREKEFFIQKNLVNKCRKMEHVLTKLRIKTRMPALTISPGIPVRASR